MPFDRPTLEELITRARADFRARLGISGQLVRRAVADVLANVWAGAVHMTHGQLEFLSEQLFGDTAIGSFLVRLASLYGLEQTPAAFAVGDVTATGTDPTPISVGEILVRDDGAFYEVTVGGVISGGTATLTVQAVEAGQAGNLDTGETLTFESPIAGVDATVTVDAPGLSGGTDEETIEELRARYLQRRRNPPQAGAEQDYIAWATSVAGVTRAWVNRFESGLGTLTVRFVRDNDVTIFPDAGEVTAVQTVIDGLRPVTADVTVAAPVENAVAFTIALNPDTAALRTAVEASLDDLFFRDGEPGDGATAGTILLSQIRTAIGVAVGDGDYTLTVPAADVVPALGELLTVGVITWV